jgi:hypothetical protein
MVKSTEKAYADELVDKGISVLQSAQNVALNGVQTGMSTLKSVVPQAQGVLTKVDLADAQKLADSAFDASSRVLSQTRTFVNDVLGSVLQKNATV